MKKTLAAVGSLVIALALSAPVAFASDITDDSELNVDIMSRLHAMFNNTNSGSFSTTSISTASSGGNTVDVGDDADNLNFRSGDSQAAAGAELDANDLTLDADIRTDHSFFNDEDVNVDDSSAADFTVDDEATVEQNNNNSVSNSATVLGTSMSGDNEFTIDDSLDGGDIRTGSSDAASLFSGSFNTMDIMVTLRHMMD